MTGENFYRMMRRFFRYFYISITVFAFLLSGCGGESQTSENKTSDAKSGAEISVNFDGKQISFAPVYAKFASFKKGLILKDSDIQNKEDRTQALVYRIYLANYDLKLSDPSKQDYERIASDGQFRVEIQIEAEKGASENAPLKAQVYQTKTEPFNRVSWINISRFEDGKDSNSILGGSKASGAVKITNVTGAEISGEIDFSDSDGSVKGKFTAQKLK